MSRNKMRIISVFVFILVNIVFCQILPIKTYNVEDGLSQSQVQVVVQDSVGYLWFGTADGLSRFDGQKFVNYTVHDGLANNEITCAYVDGDSLIWFGHSLNGITLFHQKTGKFRPVVLDSLMLFHHLNQILKDPDGAYWFGLQDAGLFRYDGKKTIHVKLFEDVKNISVRAICMGQNQKLWVGTNKGVVIIDPVNFKDVKTFRTINKNTGLPDDNITCINRDHEGNMWLGTQAGGLIQVVPGDNENKRFRFTQFTTKNGLSNNWVWKVFVDKDGAIWAGTYRGVSKLRKNCRGRNCFETILKENGLRHNTIADIFQDREGNYWFGTWGGGVSRYIGRQFETFTMTQGLPDNSVWAIIEDGHGNLWVGTEGGIAIFRKTDREGGFKFFKQLTKANGKLPGNFVISFARDRRGYIWAGLLGFGLCRVNPSNYRVKWFDNSDGLASNNISSLLIDNRNNLWIATLDSGVTRFNLTNYTTTTFNEKNGLRSNRINSISQDSEGNIFFSTMDRGITVYRNDEFVTFNKKKGLEHARINVVTQDQSGNYWIGTAASGAYYVSDKKQKHFSAKTGLGGDNVFTIVCDTQGRVWLGTKNGLDRFDPRDSSFTHFGINDGFLVVEPNQNATYVDKSGHLWFGGIYGLARFNPDQIRTAPIPAKVILDKVQVFFKDLPDFKVHTFPYTKNHFTFHFKAFFFKNPNSISYTYRLKGFYSIWSPLTKQVETTYSNLPPGQYRFQVKAR
ncbi:MAG TPA: hypothetical protein ENJ89_07470, partial [Caldithrix abyssi]|nr:hypothetical protein [Caldithrix abyssi]